MENEDAVQLYVSDPILNKDGVNQFTSYTLQGAKLPESLSRRYRDFDALRKNSSSVGQEYLFQIFPTKKCYSIPIKTSLD